MSLLKQNITWKFSLFIVIAIILTNIPFVGSYIRMINTLIHESGHAIIALLGGKVHTISLFMNTEGVTYTSHTNWFGSFFTGIAGYVFSSFIAYLSFWFISRKQYKPLIIILLLFVGLNLVLWVRNVYGVFWLISFGALFILLLYKGSVSFVQNCLLIIASILLVESLTSSFTILMLSFIQPNAAGDATGLANTTMFIPAQLWGLFFFAQSISFLVAGLKKGIYRIDK
ncbi:M50 family metallopeptidase [Bacillus sp. DTU_2020_1000418_1_SI_GHA_SEK_038]|uniref:M50 family metallopeptidase n=1 Tax=Bacillus sp. DTU_2020_1000418_1_SI_GHA_SEK_038 TaxID=3077585 RepID=UPI0028EB4711|nr:M50 family metallopeptidase [Bacillus sp. DTU_2020_1000418_1_SI_GHA_SEK_038]WNS73549.1 M50 family metallopeptidase [Bacillus sp. DTU_2020_1000418_1_SI_GHA_SEK_038]